MTNFIEERDLAFTDVVLKGDFKRLWAYCDKYYINMPRNEELAKISVYKAIQECGGIADEVKEKARKECIEAGFNPSLW